MCSASGVNGASRTPVCLRPNPDRTGTRCATRCKQIGPIDVNGSAPKQHQRKNVPICMRVTSRVLCGLGLTLDHGTMAHNFLLKKKTIVDGNLNISWFLRNIFRTTLDWGNGNKTYPRNNEKLSRHKQQKGGWYSSDPRRPCLLW